MHLEQINDVEDCILVENPAPLRFASCVLSSFVSCMYGARDEAPAIAAFRTVAYGGGTPQLRHGGTGKASEARVGSKFDGTGLANEQYGQVQFEVLITGAIRDT